MADRLKSTMKRSLASQGQQVLYAVADNSTSQSVILSVSVCNTASGDLAFTMRTKDPNDNWGYGANTVFHIYVNQSLPGYSTFIHNDKIILNQDEELIFIVPSPYSSADIEIITTLLEQTSL